MAESEEIEREEKEEKELEKRYEEEKIQQVCFIFILRNFNKSIYIF